MADVFSTDTSLDILGNATPFSFLENSHDNITERIEVRIFFLFISLLSVGLSILTNTFTIYTLHTMDSLHETENLLYKALAINDITIALGQLANVVIRLLQLHKGCFEVFLMSLFVTYVSVIIIVLINVNRFIMIMRPLHHQRLVTPKRLYCVLLVGMSSIFALVAVINILGSPSLISEDVCPGLTPKNNISDSALNLLVVLPILLGFAVILITSSGIFYKSRQQATKIAQMRRIILQQRAQPEVNNPPGNHRAVTTSGLKGLKTVGVITISYWFIWLPYLIYVSTIGGLYRFELLRLVVVVLQFWNCIWNPFILSIAYRPFRIASKNIMLKMKASCCKSNIIL